MESLRVLPPGSSQFEPVIPLGCRPKAFYTPTPPLPPALSDPPVLPGLGMACSPDAGGPALCCAARTRWSGSCGVLSERGPDMQLVASNEQESRRGNDTWSEQPKRTHTHTHTNVTLIHTYRYTHALIAVMRNNSLTQKHTPAAKAPKETLRVWLTPGVTLPTQ